MSANLLHDHSSAPDATILSALPRREILRRAGAVAGALALGSTVGAAPTAARTAAPAVLRGSRTYRVGWVGVPARHSPTPPTPNICGRRRVSTSSSSISLHPRSLTRLPRARLTQAAVSSTAGSSRSSRERTSTWRPACTVAACGWSAARTPESRLSWTSRARRSGRIPSVGPR